MSVYSTSEFDLLIQKATSESIPNGELDLPVALELSDIIRSRKLPPKDCMRCLKKRIGNTLSNPNTQLSSWKLVDVCIKNGGTPFIIEVCSREFMDTIEHTILRSYSNRGDGTEDELYDLTTKFFYELYIAFKNDSQLNYVSTVYNKLISRGVTFSEHLVDNNSPMIMFDSKTPADWIDSDACMICSKKFSILNRRHHCRSCGGIFCHEHSSHTIPLPDLGIAEEVRVCDNCFEDYDLKKQRGSKKKKSHRSKHGWKNKYDGDSEDEQLRKAIELSLNESQDSNIEPVISTIEPSRKTQEEIEAENDPELKAAIEASLREAEEMKRRNKVVYSQQQQMLQPQFQPETNYDLTTSEEEDIYLFSSLVERMKTQSVTEILEDTQLQKLYQKVIGIKPKINNSLNDKIHKYKTLIDMNGKISDIINIYDSLLEEQLRNINISQQYSIPQQPSDPYAIYQQQAAHVKQQTVQPQDQYYSQVPQVLQAQSTNLVQQVVPVTTQSEAFEDVPQNMYQETKQQVQTQHAEPKPVSQLPSEPPYPEDEETEKESITNPPHLSTMLEDGTSRLPYPMEVEGQGLHDTNTLQQNQPQKITNFDFPAVPASKLPVTEVNQEVQNKVKENEEEQVEEEKLLLEL